MSLNTSFLIKAGRSVSSNISPLLSTSSIQSTAARSLLSNTGLLASFQQPSSSFHTSSPSNAKVSKYVKSMRRIQKHYARELRKPKPEDVDPVLGRPTVPFLERLKAVVADPANMSFGLTKEEVEKLMFGAEYAKVLNADPSSSQPALLPEVEAQRREAINRILTARNADIEQNKKLAIKMAVEEFARFEGDTGSSEVQAAISTVKIHYLAAHMKDRKQDLRSMRKLQQLVHNRQGILKYLRNSFPERYYWTIEKLGLNDQAVTQEFALSGRYLEKYQFFGKNTLRVKDSKKERKEKIKKSRMEKKAQKFLRA